MSNKFYFETERIVANEWHASESSLPHPLTLAQVVQEVMSPAVTATLPPPWQGEYTPERAAQWIKERDSESTNLLALDKNDNNPIGLMILFEITASAEVRLGYMLHQSAWGKGYASELVAGLVECCRHNGVRTITGGVGRDNPASMRVLEKSGFHALDAPEDADEILFSIDLS